MQTDNAEGSSEQPVAAPTTATIQQPELDILFDAAARGDASAQSALALNAIQNGIEGRVPMRDALSCAELWARMAAAAGDPAHVLTLAKVLGSRYDHLGNVGLDEGGMVPLAEHYLCLKIAADAGDASAIASVRVLNDIAAVTPIVDAVWSDATAALAAMPETETAAAETSGGEAAQAAPKRSRKPAAAPKIKVPSKPRTRRAKAA